MSEQAAPPVKREWKAFFWPSLLLASALVMALASGVARRDGQPYASAFLALIALLSAAVSSLVLIPKLVARLRFEFLSQFRLFRFTGRGVTFVLLVLVVAFASLNTGNNLLILVLSVLLSALIVSGAVSNLVLHGLRISLSLPETIHAGQKTVFMLTLENLKRFFPSFALRLKSKKKGDARGGAESSFFVRETLFPYIPARGQLSSRIQCRFEKRGVYPLAGFEVRTQFPFGFFSRGRTLAARGNIVVYPPLVEIGGLVRSFPSLTGVIERRRKGMGSGLYNIRPYRGGEGTRFVHWKSTAKLSQLMVKDFVAEEDAPFRIFFSTYLPARPGADEQFEKAVSCIASLGHHYRRAGCPFHFSTSDFDVAVNAAAPEYEMFMEYLSLVSPQREKTSRAQATQASHSVVFAADPSHQWPGVQTIDYMRL